MSCPLTGRDLTHKNTRNLASVTCRVFRVRVIFIAVRPSRCATASRLPLSTFPAIWNQLECQSAPNVKYEFAKTKFYGDLKKDFLLNLNENYRCSRADCHQCIDCSFVHA